MFFKQKFIKILECLYFVFLGGAKRFFLLTSGSELNLQYFPNFFPRRDYISKTATMQLTIDNLDTEDKQK